MPVRMITGEVQGRERVSLRLQVLTRTVSDLRPFFNGVFAPRYFAEVQDGFTMSGQRRSAGGQFVGGTRWAPLKPAYAAWKRKHYGDLPILTRTGALRDSLTWTGNGLGPGGRWTTTNREARFSSSLPYFSVHQKGRRDGSMPARPPLPPIRREVYRPLLRQWVLSESARLSR